MGKVYADSGRVAAVLLFCLLGWSLRAQDARFAQFYASPLQVNPALTGLFAGQMRLTVNYRELYTSILGNQAYRTISAGAEMRYPVSRSDYAAFGLTALRDQVGESQFTRTQGALSGAYLKQLSGGRSRTSGQYLVAGAQLGFGQRGFDWQKLWFSEQFFVDDATRQAFVDYGASSGETFPSMRTGLYLDFNAGLLWYTVNDENNSFYVGGSIFHLNQPNISFTEDFNERLYRKFVGHLGGELPFGRTGFSLLPAAAVMSQGPAFSTTAGANLRFSSNEWREVALRAGAWAHVSNRLEQKGLDAIILSSVLELNQWQLGFSYDLTTSSLTRSNNARGAFEVSLIYMSAERARSSVLCPNF